MALDVHHINLITGETVSAARVKNPDGQARFMQRDRCRFSAQHGIEVVMVGDNVLAGWREPGQHVWWWDGEHWQAGPHPRRCVPLPPVAVSRYRRKPVRKR